MSTDSEFEAREAAEKTAAYREFVRIGQELYWPQTHRWLHPKRIIPPHGYWSASEIAEEEEFTFLCNLTTGQVTSCREALGIHYTTVALAHHEHPTWHVGGALVQALLRTTVPAEWPAERCRMPFPAIRLILEKGSLLLEDGSEVAALQAYLAEPSSLVRLPPIIAEELSTLDRDPLASVDRRVVQQASAARKAVSALARVCPPTHRDLVIVVWQTPAPPAKFRFTVIHTRFDATLGDVVSSQLIAESTDNNVFYRQREHADRKRAIVENCFPLFLNAVLLLTAKPDYVEGGGIARPARIKGKRRLEGLYHPRFLGKKFAYQRGDFASEKISPGRKLPPGWRAGHWKDIAYGPDHSLRRHDWIEPYQYGLDGG